MNGAANQLSGAVLNLAGSTGGGTAWWDLQGNSQAVAGLQSIAGASQSYVQSTGGAAILTINNAGAYTYAGTIQNGIGGTLGLVVAGPGTQVLSGANNYTGGTTVSGGQLNINNNSAVGSGTLTMSGGSLGNTSGSTVTLGSVPQNWANSFSFVGPGSLNLGTGNVLVSVGSNMMTLNANAGTLTVGGNLNANGANLTMATNGGGTVVLAGSVSGMN